MDWVAQVLRAIHLKRRGLEIEFYFLPQFSVRLTEGWRHSVIQHKQHIEMLACRWKTFEDDCIVDYQKVLMSPGFLCVSCRSQARTKTEGNPVSSYFFILFFLKNDNKFFFIKHIFQQDKLSEICTNLQIVYKISVFQSVLR